MVDSKFENTVISLRHDVDRHFGKRLETTTDFAHLSQEIAISKAGYISTSTLKRYWGYVKHHYLSKRITTLDILARYVGYSDFNHYAASIDNHEATDSDYNSSLSLDAHTLQPGTKLLISWYPDRSIIVTYQGNLIFLVMKSTNSRLTEGMRIKCMTMVKGQPLILNIIDTYAPDNSIIYIAGKKHGIDWKTI